MKISRRTLLSAALMTPVTSIPTFAFAEGKGGHLRYGLSAFPPSLDPFVNTGAAAGAVKLLINRSLLSFNPQGELEGALAEKWELDANGAWVFKLRSNAFFHNGDPVTSADIKWSIEQIAAEGSKAYMRDQFQEIRSIETPDKLTVRLVTNEPLATLPLWFVNFSTFMISAKSTKDNPIGAGPFRLASAERGTSLELERFDKYYEPGLPKLDRITMTAYADESLRVSALQSGDVDMIEYVPWTAMEAVEKDPRLKLQNQNGPFTMLIFNGSKAPFNNPLVRQAVAHAIQRQEIVDAVFYGRAEPLEGLPISRSTPWFDEKLSKGLAYDPKKAKALLAEAGYADGFTARLLSTAQYSMHKDTAQIVQQHLAAIGINVELVLPDWATRVSKGSAGDYDIAIHGQSADNNDPDGLSGLVANLAVG